MLECLSLLNQSIIFLVNYLLGKMYSGAAIWNSLPLYVKNATSVNT